MRASTLIIGFAALVAPAIATQSTAVPIQQIADGQIQNPATPPPAPPASSPAPPAPPASSPAPPAPPAPPKTKPSPPPPAPSGGGIPPSYGNVTSTISKSHTKTATVVKPSGPSAPSGAAPPAPPASSVPASAPSAPKPSAPSVQTAGASTLVGSTLGLGAAALIAALLG